MEQDNAKAFLGVGLKFPVQVDKNTGRMMTSFYEEDIQEAIRIILSTRKGERVRNPRFGCGIHEYMFDTMDFTTISAIRHEVEMALVLWEPRIENIEVSVDTREEEGVIFIEIGYVVRSTNSPFNMVLPFYINEGNM